MRQAVPGCTLSVILLIMAGCMQGCLSHSPDHAPLERAWDLCEALQYDAAFPMVREYLLRHPESAMGHYLLGKCYMARQQSELTLAKGEFDTARALFDQREDLEGLDARMTPDQFRAALHCDTALALLRTVYEAERQGIPMNRARPILRNALDHARQGLAYHPESSFLEELTAALSKLLAELGDKSPPPVYWSI